MPDDVLPPKGFEFDVTMKAYWPDGTLRCQQTTHWWGMNYNELLDLEESQGVGNVQTAVALGRARWEATHPGPRDAAGDFAYTGEQGASNQRAAPGGLSLGAFVGTRAGPREGA